MTPSRKRETWLLLAVAVAARFLTFGNPAVHADEEFYFVVARALAEGAWPYVDVWDRKPVGLFLLYLPAAALPWPWGVWAYQLTALAFVTLTAAVIARLARTAGWHRGATAAGVAYILWLNLAEGQGGQAPVFYTLFVAAAALLVCLRGRKSAIAAMALIGVALQIKPSVVFEGLFFGLWICARDWRHHRQVGRTLLLGAALVAVAVLPTLAVMAAYAWGGHFGAWWYANVHSIFQRRPDPGSGELRNLLAILLLLSPLLAASALTVAQRQRDGVRSFLFGWLLASLAGLLLFRSWFIHYGLPVMAPAAVCAAGAMGDLPRLRRWVLPVLLLVALVGQVMLGAKLKRRGTAAEFAAVDRAIGRGPGCLWVYSGDPMFYASSDRRAVTAYRFPSHLGLAREGGAIGVDQRAEIERVLARRPAVIVVRPPYRGERPDLRALVLARLADGYRETAAVPQGKHLTRIYRPR